MIISSISYLSHQLNHPFHALSLLSYKSTPFDHLDISLHLLGLLYAWLLVLPDLNLPPDGFPCLRILIAVMITHN